MPAEPAVPLIVFGGDCTFTPARLVIDRRSHPPVLRTRPEQLVDPVPGVDYRRLMLERRHRYTHFPLRYSFLLCARHDRLPGNVSFQDNLLDALLTAL